MRSTFLALFLIIVFSWGANAQNRLQELQKSRAYYQKKLAEANTKPNGLHLRAINDEIVDYIVMQGYDIIIQSSSSNHKIPIRDPHNPTKILTNIKAGDEVVVYERQGKNTFLVRTTNDVVGLIHKEAFGNHIHEYPLEVLVHNHSPKEQAALERHGVIEQKKLNCFSIGKIPLPKER